MDLTYEQLGGSDEIKRFDSIVSVERVITKFTAVHGQHCPYPSSSRLFNVSACVLRRNYTLSCDDAHGYTKFY
jgi:hypothetical protein